MLVGGSNPVDLPRLSVAARPRLQQPSFRALALPTGIPLLWVFVYGQ
jgi:hypothetical protein